MNTLVLKSRKYIQIFQISAATSLSYLANFFSRSFPLIIRIWIFTQLYTVSFATVGNTVIGGMTIPMTIWTLMLAQSLQSATRPHLASYIEEDVKTGSLAYAIIRPYSYLAFHWWSYLGRALPTLLMSIVIGGITTLVLVGPISISISSLAGGILLTIFGLILHFFISIAIGITAFWIEDIAAFIWIYSKSQLLLGGLIVPLSVFPETYRTLAESSPFGLLFYAPARLFANFDSSFLLHSLIAQIIWIIFFAAISFFLYSKGLKRVSVNGG